MKRDLITLDDFSSQEIHELLDLAQKLKKRKGCILPYLQGKTVCLIFQKPSNRTRVSFEVGIHELGGNCIYLGPKEIALGQRETAADVAKTLSRYLHGIVARTNSHADVVELGKQASIPIINGLSDIDHPCQALADIFSVREKYGKFKGLTLAFIGDGNNVCHSLLLACAKVGLNMNIASPEGYEPDKNIVKRAFEIAKTTQATIKIGHSAQDAIKGVQIIYADVFVSMGQEKERAKRLRAFKGYQINGALTKLADPNYIFMHCLPAHRGEEVSAEIIDSSHSIVFDQAENRMHVQKAVLTFLLGPNLNSLKDL
jgi:ornithine carbamoyltransferase